MKYIIDGYNLVHKIQRLQGKKLRTQREALIVILELAQLTNRCLKDLTVVFDGQHGVLAPPLNSLVKVIFAKGISADKKIKQMVASSSYARDIGVVSDDRQIRSSANALGAKKISVESFLKLIHSSGKKPRSFKLEREEKEKINQELEKVWLQDLERKVK